MWWFALLYFANAVLPHNSVVYNDAYRLDVAGFPVNILDGLILLGGIMSLLPTWTQNAMPVTRLHPAFTRGLTLLSIALVVGVIQSFIFSPELPERFRLPPIRNFLLVPVCLYIGYRCLAQPRQVRTAFWIVFLASIGSAMASVLTQGQATAMIGESGSATSLDRLRLTALDVPGDAGLLAASAILFTMISGVPLLPKFLRAMALMICAAGMFLIPHRSAWLLDAITLGYAGFVMWPFNLAKKVFINLSVFVALLAAGAILIVSVQSQTQRDMGKWVSDRLTSLMPGQEGLRSNKAWDTRIPGMLYELRLAMVNPILGRGFAAQDRQAIEDAEYYSFRHTPWVTTLCETGLVGVAGFGFAIVGLWVVGLRMVRQGQDRWFILLGAVGTSWGIVCFFAGLMTLHWNSPRSAITLGLLAGVIFRARDMMLSSSHQNAQQLALGQAPTEYSYST